MKHLRATEDFELNSVTRINPVPHCWSESQHSSKKKFCNVCRKKLEDAWALKCEICGYHIHTDCQDIALPNCKECATYIPERSLENYAHSHHWREVTIGEKNPVPHCWSESQHSSKKKFCNVCRKKLEDAWALKCEICGYHIHTDCQDIALPNCKECATYIPERSLENYAHSHHWREGNLPPNSKCYHCKKSCWSAECLTGLRCQWCGIT
ncbi:unnamed protein product, partial [Cyprideis torosa]